MLARFVHEAPTTAGVARAGIWLCAATVIASAGCRYGYDEVSDGGLPGNPVDAGAPDADIMVEPVEYGRGTAGLLALTQGELQVNEYAAVSEDVPRQSKRLTIDRPLSAPAGSLVLLWQAGTREPVESGLQSSIVLEASAVGQWELVRLASDLDGTEVTLERGTSYQYAAGTTQMVTVPEYTGASIGPDTGVMARAWDGQVGGILAFVVAGELAVEGALSATGAGYRGGISVPDGDEDLGGCLDLDQPAPGGEAKGEGIALGRHGPGTTGRGNLANGGGGGSCHNNGGGGGGNQGAGGHGGIVDYESPALPPALGGAPTVASSIGRLSMGGGGGAGESHHGSRADGGSGGGVILIGARSISGMGVIEADGEDAPRAGEDGGGGGGAGGAIYIRSDEIAGCVEVSTRGGAGGDSEAGASGGGGGGGRVVTPALSCPALVDGGAPGRGSNSADPTAGGTGAILTIAAGGF